MFDRGQAAAIVSHEGRHHDGLKCDRRLSTGKWSPTPVESLTAQAVGDARRLLVDIALRRWAFHRLLGVPLPNNSSTRALQVRVREGHA